MLKLGIMITVNLVNSGGSRDDVEILMDFGDEKITLRIKSLSEGEKWKRLLVEWKDFSNLNSSGKLRSNSAVIDDDEETGGGASGNKARSISGELNAMTFDESVAGTAGGGGAKKGGLMGMFKRNSAGGGVDQRLEAAAASAAGGVGHKPTMIEGYLEKKHHIGSMHISSEWQKVFCKIDEATTSMMYFKSNNLSSPAGSIDLKMTYSIDPYEKGTRKEDPSRFNIDMGDGKVYKFKCKGNAEGVEWVSKLEAWREYFLLQ